MKCCVSTHTPWTIFGAEVARGLHLPVANPFRERVDTFLRPYRRWWCKHSLWLLIHPALLPVEVWFPVAKTGNTWDWRFDVPMWNVLGMNGVLNRRMFSVTCEQVCTFERI